MKKSCTLDWGEDCEEEGEKSNEEGLPTAIAREDGMNKDKNKNLPVASVKECPVCKRRNT